jgi:DNA mismatch repair ATPase MutS
VANRLSSSLGCRTLFATHFHELTELQTLLPTLVSNLHTTAEVTGEKLTLLYQIQPGRHTSRNLDV